MLEGNQAKEVFLSHAPSGHGFPRPHPRSCGGRRCRARAPRALSAPKGETTKAAPAWAAFFGQPSGAAITTVAFALLWFTALTPHAPVLLAALADRGAPAESLAAFHAAGALAGAGGVALYAAAAAGRPAPRPHCRPG